MITEKEFLELITANERAIDIECSKRATADYPLEDLKQDALLKIFRNRAKYDPTKAKFSTYVYTVVRNLANDNYRSNKPLKSNPLPLMDEVYNRGTFIECEHDKEVLIQTLRECLSQREYQIMIMRSYGFKFEEIAKQMNIKANSVRPYIHRARKKAKIAFEMIDYKLKKTA